MNFDPQKFYIGFMEFFAILLPGALFTYLMISWAGLVLPVERFKRIEGFEAWAVFLFASYLFGHIISLLSSWLDELYDWARGNTLKTQISRMAHEGTLLPRFIRALIWLVFKDERDLAVDRARRIKEQALDPFRASEAVNTYQWSKAWLNMESKQSLALVHRFEADSKFFRCLSVSIILISGLWIIGVFLKGIFHIWPWPGQWQFWTIPALFFILLMVLIFRILKCIEKWPTEKLPLPLGFFSLICLIFFLGSALHLSTSTSLPASWPHLLVSAILLLFLLPFSLWRYMEQRFKATNQAYWSVITIVAKKIHQKPHHKKTYLNEAPPQIAHPGRAAGILSRGESDKIEVLLVMEKKKENFLRSTNSHIWVLPKGRAEDGEKLRETAVRKVREETGVWAAIIDDLGNVSWQQEEKEVVRKNETGLFEMQERDHSLPKRKARKAQWMLLKDLLPSKQECIKPTKNGKPSRGHEIELDSETVQLLERFRQKKCETGRAP